MMQSRMERKSDDWIKPVATNMRAIWCQVNYSLRWYKICRDDIMGIQSSTKPTGSDGILRVPGTSDHCKMKIESCYCFARGDPRLHCYISKSNTVYPVDIPFPTP